MATVEITWHIPAPSDLVYHGTLYAGAEWNPFGQRISRAQEKHNVFAGI